jgi:hypothetical protein
MDERPLGVTVLGILWLIAGLIFTSAGAYTTLFGGLAFGSWGFIIGIGFILWGLLELGVGLGTLTGRTSAWVVGIVLAVLNLVEGIYGLFAQGWTSLLTVAIAAIILYYLFTPEVRAFFGQD